MHRQPFHVLLALLALAGLGGCGEDKSGTAAPDPSTSVAVVCAPDQCEIAGVCREHLEVNPANGCEACVVPISRSRFSPWEVSACDDGNACTTDDACQLGRCGGRALLCDDDDPCTSDRCDPATGQCTASPDVAKCGVDHRPQFSVLHEPPARPGEVHQSRPFNPAGKRLDLAIRQLCCGEYANNGTDAGARDEVKFDALLGERFQYTDVCDAMH